MKALIQLAVIAALIATLGSCADDKTCNLVGLQVMPTSATASHLAQTPNNQVRFAANGDYEGKCVLLACVDCEPGVTWSVSDPANVSLGPSQSGISAVTATCIGATNGAVTVTATKTASGRTLTGTATLACQ